PALTPQQARPIGFQWLGHLLEYSHPGCFGATHPVRKGTRVGLAPARAVESPKQARYSLRAEWLECGVHEVCPRSRRSLDRARGSAIASGLTAIRPGRRSLWIRKIDDARPLAGHTTSFQRCSRILPRPGYSGDRK